MSLYNERTFKLGVIYNKNVSFETLKIVFNEFSKEIKGFRLDLSLFDDKQITYSSLKELLSKMRIVIIIYDKKKKSYKLIKLLEIFQNIYEKILNFLIKNKINVNEFKRIYEIFLHIQGIYVKSLNKYIKENASKDKTLLLSSLL